MILKSPAIRLTIALVLLTVNLLFLANVFGILPDESKSVLDLRKGLSESLALQFSAVAEKGEFQIIQNTLRAVVERNDDIRSAAIRTINGDLIALAGNHLAHWKNEISNKSTSTQVQVPVYRQGKKWARVEIRFAPLWTDKLLKGFSNSFIGLLLFIGLSCFISFFFIIKHTLRELDPSAVIPERVQRAFDVLQEGVLILDRREQIVMANKFIAGLLNRTPEAIIGLKGSELGWLECESKRQIKELPWTKVLQDGVELKGASLSLLDSLGSTIKLMVNASAVTDSTGKLQGCLVTFGDITEMEEKNLELNHLVEKLQLSQWEITSKNKELEYLANSDPLTLCLNRRSLDKKFDVVFDKAKTSGMDLSCLMVDIDLFKSVNDRYGHATGDLVIKSVADVLKTCTRDDDLVGRYGGEEFCVVLPHVDLETAARIAERIRKMIEKKPCGGVQITVSLGVSSLSQNASKRGELVNQADKALYAAKRGGRNRVVALGRSDAPDSAGLISGKDEPSAIDDSRSATGEQAQLVRRINDLEGQLEKRNLEFEHHEMYDSKTGLPNRSLFEDRLSLEIMRSKRTGYFVVVMSLTIEMIKRVEETLGYRAAIQLVKICGKRLNDVLRKGVDTIAVFEDLEKISTVSLISQTEFGILLTEIKQIDHVTWVIKRLLDAFDKPFQIQGQEIYASAYIGVSIFPYDGQSAEELHRNAVNACNYAKKAKKNHYLFSSRDINKKAVRQLQIETCLHGALDNNEFQLYFQPLVKAGTGAIVGFEALLRWKNARLGLVPPDEFIQVAEQSGQIDRIGDWVLYQGCRQLRDWLDGGFDIGWVAINLSGLQLRQRGLANRIQGILDEFNLEPSMLEIELTESSLVEFHDKSFAVLKEIRDLGIRVVMDDFGTGYSSLSYLTNLPLSRIKIDRSFSAEIGKNENTEKLIALIVSMAHELGLEVVAEGVEDEQQVDYVTALGCEYLQGYFFGRPMPAAQVAEILEAGRSSRALSQG